MPVAIKADNISKVYQLGQIGTGTISRDVERFFARIRGKEDPFLRIGETNDRTVKGTSDMVWSLKDINFEINQGDAVGVIGGNGAGKSTLLKILSRVTSPTTGSLKIKGRIASLLEVGTGFHPELSGRENIYLNGAILGMRKAEIKRKFDEIVAFSGVERYVDTPVKRYSSGMYVRLAFAVAAHLESEILLIDEVLAVGDAEFQKKCLGKMDDISKGEGRTLLFVSHNMASIKSICKKGILLKSGMINYNGNINDAVNAYSINLDRNIKTRVDNFRLKSEVVIKLFEISHAQIITHTNLDYKLILQSNGINPTSTLLILIFDQYGQRSAIVDLRSNDLFKISGTNNEYKVNGTLKNLPFLPGIYQLGIYMQSNNASGNFYNILQFEVVQKSQIDKILPFDISERGSIDIEHIFTIK